MPDSDSSPEDSPPNSLPDEQVAAILAAKPLPPKPRPAFTRKAKAKTQNDSPDVNLDDIPEAVPLDMIPEGIPLDDEPAGKKSRPTQMERPALRTPGNRPLRTANSAPKNRVAPVDGAEEEAEQREPLDKSKFASFERYERGEISVQPLEKAPGMESRQIRQERPKFLDGELPRRIERGVQYPLPGRVLFTAFILLLFKLSLFGTIFGLTAVLLVEPENIAYAIWLPISLIFFGIVFMLSAHRTRCRICSCHMFYNRRCFKHQKAHRLFGLGYAGSAALHALLFRWLRCMYCGTAIRLRPAKPDSEEEVNRPIASQRADYDKSLIKPRPPR